ncbi:ATP-binding protein [Mesorhizobium sp.]|uniref:ATP-binding protein n=1 Tax=Mesorhizobium sp. TaxID=1871066 RepID=UPI0025D337EB|nr:ATP-binding protein [Mesorhizobium sp.]
MTSEPTPSPTNSTSICSKSSRNAIATNSTLITAQVPVARWHDLIADPTVADAILVRIVHNAHRIVPQGRRHAKAKGRAPLDRRRKRRNQSSMDATRHPRTVAAKLSRH